MKNAWRTGARPVTPAEMQGIQSALPRYEAILTAEAHIPFEKVAVSVFDSWLGKDRLHLLDCTDQAERDERDLRHWSFCARLFDEGPVYAAQVADASPLRITDRQALQILCANDPDKGSADFYALLLPQHRAVYQEHWDDTNVLWFRDRSEIAALEGWAQECGLHVIEYT